MPTDDLPPAQINELLTDARAFFWETDACGLYTAILGPLELILGYRPQQLINTLHFYDLHPAEGREAFTASCFKFIQQRASFHEFINPMVHRDGHVVWVRTNGVPVIAADGEVLGYRGLDIDITASRQTRMELEQAEAKWRSYIEHAPYGICVADENGRYLEFNDELCRSTGYTREQLLAMGIPEMIVPDGLPDALSHFEQVKREGYAFGEYPYRHASGETRWWSVAAVKLSDTQFIGYSMDVTGRRGVDSRMRQLYVAAEQSNEGISIADTDGNVLYVNPAWAAMHGRSVEDIMGRNLEIFHTPEQLEEQVKPSLARMMSTGYDNYEVDHVRADGSVFPMAMNTALVRDDIGTVIGMIATGQDLTESRIREREREKLIRSVLASHRDLTEFSYITSHNLRGPLTNLISLCDLLRSELAHIGEAEPLIHGIEQSTRQLTNTVEELTRLLAIKSRPPNRRMPLHFEDILQPVLAELSADIQRSGMVCERDFSAAAGVEFEPSYLKSVFHHLLINAIQFRDPERPLRVAIRSRRLDGKVELLVADNGSGLDLEPIGKRLFQLYQCFHEGYQTRGVGLYLVKSQLAALGASIRATGAVGKGLTFIIEFPAS